MQITIKTFTNGGKREPESTKLAVTRGHTIRKVKGMMEELQRIPASEQILMSAGKKLEDAHTLGYYNIPNTAILRMDYNDRVIGEEET